MTTRPWTEEEIDRFFGEKGLRPFTPQTPTPASVGPKPLTDEEIDRFFAEKGLSRFVTSPGAPAPPVGAEASNLPSLPTSGAPGAATPSAPGIPREPDFVDPYGLGSFIALERPGGPQVPAPQTPFEPGGPLAQTEPRVNLGPRIERGLQVAALPARVSGEALVRGTEMYLNPVAALDTLRREQEALAAAPPAQGAEDWVNRRLAASKEAMPLPWGVRGAAEMVADPLNLVPGLGLLPGPNVPAGGLRQFGLQVATPPVAQVAEAVTPPPAAVAPESPVQRGMLGVPDRTVTAQPPMVQGDLEGLRLQQKWGQPAVPTGTPLEQAQLRAHEAQQNLDVLQRSEGFVPMAPKFGTAEQAEYEAARRGRMPKAQQVAQAQRQMEKAQQDLLTLQNEVPQVGLPAGAGPPPVAGGADPGPSFLQRVQESQLRGERLDQTALRLHEAGINTAQRKASQVVANGNVRLRELNIGAPVGTTRAARSQDIPVLDNLYEALHSPSKVAAGEVQIPKGMEDVYTNLRQSMDWESLARLDFDPEMATVDDYFYRGWKPPAGRYAETAYQRGKLVSTPAFQKPRVDATYREMRDLGFEPLYWNPYEQWRVARMQGERYRQQMELVDALKSLGDDVARPDMGGSLPAGWRVPQVGPAFEGKPFASVNPGTGAPEVMYTRRWMVPDRVANVLESMYGKKPDMGKVTVGGKTADIRSVVDWLTFMPKRAKLVGSFFQQMDFLTRSGVGAWTGMVDALYAGKPVRAVKHLAMYPKTAGEMLGANFIPSWRTRLINQLDQTAPLLKGRPGVNMRAISEAGLSLQDVTILPKDMDKIAREVAQEAGVVKAGKAVPRALASLESAMRRGLFEGVYPAAILNDVRYNIAPVVAHLYPDLTDSQLASRIAVIANKKYSTIPASQSVITNRAMRETLRRVFFSIGETEGLLRQAVGTVKGAEKAYWIEHWLGAYLFLIGTASVIHFASTGKPLPKERFTPVSKDPYSRLGFGYNTKFAAPTIPLKGRGGAETTLDLVGQLDTAFRVLAPQQFIQSRVSVPIRALESQRTGKDFFGAPIDDVGPGGVVSRTVQLALDMFSPIGVGQAGTEIARQTIPEVAEVLPEGESRLGVLGNIIQATGLNLRAETTPDLLDARAQELAGVPYKQLWPMDKDELMADPDLKQELTLRTETSAERGLPSAQYQQAKEELALWRDAEVAKLAKSPKLRTSKKDQNAVEGAYYDIEAEHAHRSNQLAQDLLGDKDYVDATEGVDLGTAEGQAEVVRRIAAEQDPLKRALAEYYMLSDLASYHNAQTPGVTFSAARKQFLMDYIQNKWTPEQYEYVMANTNRREVPKEILPLLSDFSKQLRAISEQARTQHRQKRQAGR